MSDVKRHRVQSSGCRDEVRKAQVKEKGCFHNSCCSNEFVKRMDVTRDVTTQQASDKCNDEIVDPKKGRFWGRFWGSKRGRKKGQKRAVFWPPRKT